MKAPIEDFPHASTDKDLAVAVQKASEQLSIDRDAALGVLLQRDIDSDCSSTQNDNDDPVNNERSDKDQRLTNGDVLNAVPNPTEGDLISV